MCKKKSQKWSQFEYYQSFGKKINIRNTARYFDNRCQLVADHVQMEQDIAILDLGCGDGLFLTSILQRFAKFSPRVTGIDISPHRIEMAQQHVPGGDFCVATADQVPFPDGSFDLVMCNALLHHVPNVRLTLTEMARVCRKNGQILLIEPNKTHPLICLQAATKRIEWGTFGLSYSRIKAWLKAEGFVVKTVPLNCLLYPYQRFPPAFLFRIFSWLEHLLETRFLSTHIVFLADRNVEDGERMI